MKSAPKKPARKSLLKASTTREIAKKSPFSRSEYRSEYNKMVKGGMPARTAVKKIREMMKADIETELNEYFRN